MSVLIKILHRFLVQLRSTPLGAYFDIRLLKRGNRSVTRRVRLFGRDLVYKRFDPDETGLHCFATEVMANHLFDQQPWVPKLFALGNRRLLRTFYPDDLRVDRVVTTLGDDQRQLLARQAIDVLFHIFAEGYAHRDFHAGNLYWVDGQLIVTDFECMGEYPTDERPPFPKSYDITGTGLESPYRTHNMGYLSNDVSGKALNQVLKIPIDSLLRAKEQSLIEELRDASLTFQTKDGRHTCQSGKIYTSFNLPYITVSPKETQRNSGERLKNFQIVERDLAGRTVLVLGSNTGGILFEVQSYHPAGCLGIEVDGDKVEVARKIAAYNGLNNVRFMEGDIERLQGDNIGGRYDVVFCLAMESHVRDKKQFFRLLGQVTSDILYFEGNANSNLECIEQGLLSNGFKRLESLGNCDDRPLLRAYKSDLPLALTPQYYEPTHGERTTNAPATALGTEPLLYLPLDPSTPFLTTKVPAMKHPLTSRLPRS